MSMEGCTKKPEIMGSLVCGQAGMLGSLAGKNMMGSSLSEPIEFTESSKQHEFSELIEDNKRAIESAFACLNTGK